MGRRQISTGVSRQSHAQMTWQDMENNFEDFFSHNTSTDTPEVEIETTTETPQVEAVEEPQTEAAPEPDPTTEPNPEPEARTDDRSKWVPVGALQDERNKARAAIEEANSLRQQMASLQAQQQAKAIPDPYDDPTAYHAAMQQQMAATVAQQVALQNLNISRARAVEKYGQDVMNEVADWAGQQASRDPSFESKLFAQPDPAEWVIAEKRRDDELHLFTTDREAFLRAEFEKMGLTAAPQTSVPITTPPSKKLDGPASIVNAKSRDTAEPMKPADAFDEIFRKR